MGQFPPPTVAIILFLVLISAPTFGRAQHATIECSESECANTCLDAYKDRLIKSYCRDLPFDLGSICVCEHTSRHGGGDIEKAYIYSKPMPKN